MVIAVGKNWRKFGHLIDGIEDGLSQLQLWMFEHIKKYVNSAAYSLA